MKNKGNAGCLILCGGKSSRMGQDKAKLKYRNRSFLEIICDVLTRTAMPCYVSLANHEETIPEGLIPLHDAVHDEKGETIGPLGGIYTGLKQAEKDGLCGLFTAAVDAPLFQTEILELISQAQKKEPEADIYIPETPDGRVHPTAGYYRMSAIAVMEELIKAHDYRLRSLINHEDLHCVRVKIENEAQEKMLWNINSPKDYEALINQAESKKTHIVLQAERGAGKSTLIAKLTKRADLKTGGYLTRALYNAEKGCRDIYMVPASCLKNEENPDETALRCGRLCGSAMNGIRERYPDVFDTYGVSLLEDPAEAQLIVMDEIGLLENEAYAFQKKVLSLLDGKIPVIAAVKTKDKTSLFLEAVRTHENVRLIELNENNRDENYEVLAIMFQQEGGEV